jgi:hypothetical protein
MDSEKLTKLKASLESFNEILSIAKELIEEVEEGGGLDAEEIYSMASDIENQIDNAERNLSEAESYVSSASSDITDARNAAKQLMRVLENHR